MRQLLPILTLLLALCGAVQAQDMLPERIISEVTDAQTRLDKAFADEDEAVLRSMMLPDHIAILPYADGPLSLKEQLAATSTSSYEFLGQSNQSFDVVSDTLVLVTSDKTYKGSYADHPMPPKVFSLSIWVKSDGAWMEKYYQETVFHAEK